MTSNRKIAILIILSTAVASAVAVITGFFTITTAVGVAVCGIIIGTGFARGAFSATRNPPKQK